MFIIISGRVNLYYEVNNKKLYLKSVHPGCILGSQCFINEDIIEVLLYFIGFFVVSSNKL